MIESMSQKLVQWQIAKNIILDKDRSVYEYSYIVLIGEIITVLITCIIAAVFRYPILFVFMIAYIPLRIYAGGYHADSSERCMVFSAITLIAVCMIGKYSYAVDRMGLTILLEVTADAVVIWLSPVEDQNKPLDRQETKKYRKYVYVLLLAEITVAIFFYLIKWQEASFMLMLTHLVMAVMLILGKLKNHELAKAHRRMH